MLRFLWYGEINYLRICYSVEIRKWKWKWNCHYLLQDERFVTTCEADRGKYLC